MSNVFPGDEGVVRVKVKDVKGDHVLVDSLNPPLREFWFPASYFERTVAGPASLDSEKRAAVGGLAALEPAIVGAGTAVAVDDAPLKEQAVAHVMSRGYDRVTAEKIVEEVGTKTILADREDEREEAEREKKRLEQAKQGETKATVDMGNQNQAQAQTPEKPN